MLWQPHVALVETLWPPFAFCLTRQTLFPFVCGPKSRGAELCQCSPSPGLVTPTLLYWGQELAWSKRRKNTNINNMPGKVATQKIEAFISERKNCAPNVDPNQIVTFCCVSQEFGSAFCGMSAVL
jgi:hypothetical protein